MEYSNKNIFRREKYEKMIKEREKFIYFPIIINFLHFRELIVEPLNEKLAVCYLDLAVFFSTNSSDEEKDKMIELENLLSFSKDPLYIHLVKNVINELAEKLLFSFLAKIEYLAAAPFKKIDDNNLFFLKSSLELDRIIVQKEEKIGADERFEIILEKNESTFIISDIIFFSKDLSPSEQTLKSLNNVLFFLVSEKYLISNKISERVFRAHPTIKYAYSRVENNQVKELAFSYSKLANKKFNNIDLNGSFSFIKNFSDKVFPYRKNNSTFNNFLLVLDKLINLFFHPKDKDLCISSFLWLLCYFIICIFFSADMIMKASLILEAIAKFSLGAISFIPAVFTPITILLLFFSYKLSKKKSYSLPRVFLYKISSFYLFASFFISILITEKGLDCVLNTLLVRNMDSFIYFNDNYYLVDSKEKRKDFFLGKKSFQFSYPALSYEETKEHIHNNCINYFQVTAVAIDSKHYYCEGLHHDYFLFESKGHDIFKEIDSLYDKEKAKEMLRRTLWSN